MSMLPTEKYKPQLNLHKKTVGIYGRAGIGKSTLGSMLENTIVAQTEAGLEHLDVPRVIINSWTDNMTKMPSGKVASGFMSFCKELVTTENNYNRICIDTFDNLCKVCTEWVCSDLNINDIGDYKKFGAYHIVTAEVHRIIKKITNDTRFGLTLISHEKEEEVETKTKKYKRKTISVGGKNRDEMLDICDILFYMTSKMDGDKEVGVIQTKPSLFHEAKDKGQYFPEEIIYPLDNVSVAYEQIIKCFKTN